MKNNKFYNSDPWLKPFGHMIDDRTDAYLKKLNELTVNSTLEEFSSGHLYYGMHKSGSGLIFREWAPNAKKIYLTGSFNNWQEEEIFSLKKISIDGDWELIIQNDKLKEGDLYKLSIHWDGGQGERIPSYARSIVQDDKTKIFSCIHLTPDREYPWEYPDFTPSVSNPVIYEAHIGMSSEEEKVSSFSEFSEHVLPLIKAGGYNTIQLMAIQEHPYYGSFGYHVSNFFAVSSRFGTPDDLKALIDAAHGMGIAVIMDLVHSHSVSNVNEGLGLFDGDPGQYFHAGERRVHRAWDSLCFDYGKNHVIHFLLSNCRYWIDEYKIDGFRFDGITSMIYYDHGLGKNFTSYNMYFDGGQDIDAITYLKLANNLIHSIKPKAITIAEEMSGMPGIASPVDEGGVGFDFRLAMGVPDYWIKLIKDKSDEEWDMEDLLNELTQHRVDEQTISYCESHDQALVGDKTIIFRLIDKEMYTGMSIGSQSVIVERGIALHKMIRLITVATAQSGYLNFMGNEFGHPEWIDFPREGNMWNYKYARRQWSLLKNKDLRYKHLGAFDRAMLSMVSENNLLAYRKIEKVSINNSDKIVSFRRGKLLFVFNFHPNISYTYYGLPLKGKFRIVMDTDSNEFGGFERINRNISYYSIPEGGRATLNSRYHLHLYLPARTGIVLKQDI